VEAAILAKMADAPLRILLVDDHAVVRAGLRLLLEAVAEFEVVDEAADARDAVFKARRHNPDVILIDVLMPGTGGVDALAGADLGCNSDTSVHGPIIDAARGNGIGITAPA